MIGKIMCAGVALAFSGALGAAPNANQPTGAERLFLIDEVGACPRFFDAQTSVLWARISHGFRIFGDAGPVPIMAIAAFPPLILPRGKLLRASTAAQGSIR